MHDTRLLQRLPTFIAELSCPLCSKPIQKESVRTDPRGFEMPYCCDVYWVPKWKFVNGQIQIHLTYYLPEGMPDEKNIVHEKEIPHDADTRTPETALETSLETSGETSGETSLETSGETSGASRRQPTMIGTASELTTKERILEFLVQVNDEHTARTAEIKHACGMPGKPLADSSFKWAMDQRLEQGKVEDMGYSLWRLAQQ